jgi:hypothetical protein
VGVVILILVAVAVLGVLAKVGHDTLEIVREERREHGRVSSYGILRIAVIIGIVVIILFWLALGFIAGDNTPVY